MLKTAALLFERLNAEGIRYCHWKSNIRLDDALAGDEDIDLLVDRPRFTEFIAIVAQVGFKRGRFVANPDHPSLFHAFALDEESGKILHLHAYSRVVAGDSLVKAFVFPFDEMLLSDGLMQSGVRIPNRTVELVNFAVRLVLKHLSFFELLLLYRAYDSVVHEYEWLMTFFDEDKVKAVLAEHLPEIDLALIKEILATAGDRGAALKRVRLGRIVRRKLAHYRRVGAFQAATTRSAVAWRLIANRFVLKRRNMMLESGGALVAVVGPKASGKSTLSKAVQKPLSKHFNVEIIHAGKPPPTLLTFIPHMLLPFLRRAAPSERTTSYEKVSADKPRPPSLIHLARLVMLAWERHRLLTRAYRRAAAGSIIITDRYPSRVPGAIDSPAHVAAAEADFGLLAKLLIKLERKFYHQIPLPDMVLSLSVPLIVAIQRDASRDKAGAQPDEAIVRIHHSMPRQPEFPKVPTLTLSTERPVQECTLLAQKFVWEHL